MISGTTVLKGTLEDFMLPCLNKEFLGVECTGCGLQRAVVHLFHGEFKEAFLMYPAVYTLLLLFGFLIADQFFTFRYSNKISIALMVASIFLILTNFILKFF